MNSTEQSSYIEDSTNETKRVDYIFTSGWLTLLRETLFSDHRLYTSYGEEKVPDFPLCLWGCYARSLITTQMHAIGHRRDQGEKK